MVLEEWNWLDLVPKVGPEGVIDPRALVDSHFGVVLRSLRSLLLLTTAVNRRVRDRTFTKAVLEGFRARISKDVTDAESVKLMQCCARHRGRFPCRSTSRFRSSLVIILMRSHDPDRRLHNNLKFQRFYCRTRQVAVTRFVDYGTKSCVKSHVPRYSNLKNSYNGSSPFHSPPASHNCPCQPQSGH